MLAIEPRLHGELAVARARCCGMCRLDVHFRGRALPVGFSFHTKFTFVNQYTMNGLDDHITRFMYGRAAALIRAPHFSQGGWVAGPLLDDFCSGWLSGPIV